MPDPIKTIPSAPQPVTLGKATPTPAPTSAPAPESKPKYDHRLAVTQATVGDAVGVEQVDNATAATRFRGFCRKCGWQSHQPTQQLARDAAVQHVKKHIVDAVTASAPALASSPAIAPPSVPATAKPIPIASTTR
jgi:hypothetical protein